MSVSPLLPLPLIRNLKTVFHVEVVANSDHHCDL